MAKALKLTEGTMNALKMLHESPDSITLEEINEVANQKVASSQLTALRKYDFAVAEDVEREVVVTKTVKAYSLTEAGREFIAKQLLEQPDLEE